MEPKVRQVEGSDYAAVGDLLAAAYAPSGMAADHPYWNSLRDVEARTADAEVWVAFVEGVILGTVTWTPPGSSQREIGQDNEAEFRMLAVAPAAQGEGVGQALLNAVIERARVEGYAAVVLSSASWMTRAHRLYARFGFRRTPELDWSPMAGIELLAYRLPLSSEARR
jgi:ribosomal protein S18 acetylase RimI-like enzyme